MSYGQTYKPQGDTLYEYYWPTNLGNRDNNYFHNDNYNYNRYNYYDSRLFDDTRINDYFSNALGSCKERAHRGNNYRHLALPSYKRQKVSDNTWGYGGLYCQPELFKISNCNPLDSTRFPPIPAPPSTSSQYTVGKRGRSDVEDDEDSAALMSREEIERCSPSRKDGIDALQERRLRYSYCCFLHNLGMWLDLPQTTIGTAMVLCHRFFIRRSHACHDRFLIATAALFLAAKSEETARPLNDVLKASCEILHNQDLKILSYILPVDWFEQYRERIIEAEQLILTTLNFELNVQHPYDTLTSILNKLGVSQTHLMNLALNLVSEGFRSSLWLQFRPHQIAAGVAYVAAKMLNMNFGSCLSIWQEFQAPPAVLHDVAQQLMELFED